MEEDPDVINKMFERFSVQIIADMKRKVMFIGLWVIRKLYEAKYAKSLTKP